MKTTSKAIGPDRCTAATACACSSARCSASALKPNEVSTMLKDNPAKLMWLD